MAGAGIRLWATAETVTATAFQTYLQEQVVAVFDDSSARDAAFGGAGEPTLTEGMSCYLKDTNEFQIYSGSAWVALLDLDTFSVSSGNYTITSDLTVGGGDLSIGTTTAGGDTQHRRGHDYLRGRVKPHRQAGDATGTNQAGAYLMLKPGLGHRKQRLGRHPVADRPGGWTGYIAEHGRDGPDLHLRRGRGHRQRPRPLRRWQDHPRHGRRPEHLLQRVALLHRPRRRWRTLHPCDWRRRGHVRSGRGQPVLPDERR